MNLLLATSSTNSSPFIIIAYVVIFGALMYFLAIRPQKKQQQKTKSLLSTMETGDSVLTSSGFYGTVIDITDDTVIVEFGNNKNCRIPMQKNAIVQVEKPTSAVEQ
jgi:preprotein translocase subunit YajC